MPQGVQEQVGILPTVKAECHFVQIGREMLGAAHADTHRDVEFERPL